LLDRLKAAEAQIAACRVSDRLVPGEPTVFVVWSYERQSPNAGLAISLLDLAALQQGKRKALFQMLRGVELLPISFDGKTSKVVFADIDHSGRIAWILDLRSDADTTLVMRVYDPGSGRFQPVGPWRRGDEGMVTTDGFETQGNQIPEITGDQVKLSICRRDPARAYGRGDLYFNLYRLIGGRYMLADSARDPQHRPCGLQ
jgi:hypothetical protein